MGKESRRANIPRIGDNEGDVSFMRGLMYGLLFAIPCWAVVVGAILAVVN